MVLLGHSLGENCGPFGTHVNPKKQQKSAETYKSRRQESKQKKKLISATSQVAQCSSHPINTMVFEGSRHDHVSGFGVTLGLCSGSLSRTFVLRASFLSTWMGHPKHAARSRGSKSWSIGLKSCRDSHRGRIGPRRPGTHMLVYIYIYIYYIILYLFIYIY